MKAVYQIPEAISPDSVYPAGMNHVRAIRDGLVTDEEARFQHLDQAGVEAYLRMSINAYARVHALGAIGGSTTVVEKVVDPKDGRETILYRSGALALGAAVSNTKGQLFARTTMEVDAVPSRPLRRRPRVPHTNYEVVTFGIGLYEGANARTAKLQRSAGLSPYDHWHYDLHHRNEFRDTGDERYLPFKNYASLGALADLLDTLSFVEHSLMKVSRDSKY